MKLASLLNLILVLFNININCFGLSAIAFANGAEGVPRVISISAAGEVSATPDMMTFYANIWSKGASAQEVQTKTAELTDKCYKVLEKFNIKKEDYMTSEYFVNPEEVYDNKIRRSKIVGFNSEHTLKIIVKKSSEGGKLIDALSGIDQVQNGGISIRGISWDISKRDVLEIDALRVAVNSAKGRADVLALASGVKIKRVHSMSHQTGGETFPGMYRSNMIGMMAKGIVADAAMPETSLGQGQIKIKVNVHIAYELE